MPEILLTSELAERLNRDKATIRRWATNEWIPSTRRGTRYMLFEWAEVVEAMQNKGLKAGKVKTK